MSNTAKFTVGAGPGAREYTLEEARKEAKALGIHVTPDGDDVSDLIPKAESAEVIWGRFNKLSPEAKATRARLAAKTPEAK